MATNQPTFTDEVWKPIPKWDGYEISNYGRARSWRHRNPAKKLTAPRMLESSPHTRIPYPQYSLCALGRKTKAPAHRFVLEAFVGPCPEGMECRHLDGNPLNNHVSNLVWGTYRQNWKDRKRHGTGAEGTKNGRAKVTDADVMTIRHMWSAGYTVPMICRRFGLAKTTCHMICTSKTWKHLPPAKESPFLKMRWWLKPHAA